MGAPTTQAASAAVTAQSSGNETKATSVTPPTQVNPAPGPAVTISSDDSTPTDAKLEAVKAKSPLQVSVDAADVESVVSEIVELKDGEKKEQEEGDGKEGDGDAARAVADKRKEDEDPDGEEGSEALRDCYFKWSEGHVWHDTVEVKLYPISTLDARAMRDVLKAPIAADMTKLTINGCCLGDPELKLMSAGLCSHQSIMHLDLTSNYLNYKGGDVLGEIVDKNRFIRSLDVSKNPLGETGANGVAAALYRNSTLETLIMSDCNLGFKSVQNLAKALERNDSIQVSLLDLSMNDITEVGASALSAAIERNRSVKELRFQKNNGGNGFAASLGMALRENSTLERIDISSNNIGSRGLFALSKGLRKNNTVKVLQLAHNNLEVLGAKSLARVLYTSLKDDDYVALLGQFGYSVEKVKQMINNQGLDPVKAWNRLLAEDSESVAIGGPTPIRRGRGRGPDKLGLVKGTGGFSSPKRSPTTPGSGGKTTARSPKTPGKLNFANDPTDGDPISAAISLSSLNLNSTHIGKEGIPLLCRSLHNNTCVKELRLAWCRLFDQGAELLAKALCVPGCTIETLDLTGNRIGPSGMVELSHALANEYCVMKHLNLGHNNIGNEGIKLLGEVMPRSPDDIEKEAGDEKSVGGSQSGASTLSVDGAVRKSRRNSLSEGSELSEAIRTTSKHCTLQSLSLSCNNITHTGANLVLHWLTVQTNSLSEVNLSRNQLGDVAGLQLSKLLRTSNHTHGLSAIDVSAGGFSAEVGDHIQHSRTGVRLTAYDTAALSQEATPWCRWKRMIELAINSPE